MLAHCWHKKKRFVISTYKAQESKQSAQKEFDFLQRRELISFYESIFEFIITESILFFPFLIHLKSSQD